MIVTRDGVTWDVEAPDDFWTRMWPTWEPDTLATVDQFCRPDATFIDIGAWVGPVSLWAARCGPVLAVEPDPVALEFLARNVAKNARDVIIVNGAIADDNAAVYIKARGVFGDSMTHMADSGRAVGGWLLPDLLYEHGINSVSLVKMDIEGGETLVLPHVAPYCAEHGIPLLVATHEPWWTAPFDPAWLDGFSSVVGDWHDWGSVLCT